jgi:geranylgeranyl diphosphate/geranylgeranyl-bacteriochlorophyllide a reductase
MNAQNSIAIVGGGPAGALAATLLAQRGRRVLLFDEKLAWEKPCGGGVTYKALQRYPFLADAGPANAGPADNESECYSVKCNKIDQCELISASGQRVRFRMHHPVGIFSRLALNGLLLERAQRAGVEVRQERVTRIDQDGSGWKLVTPKRNYSADYLVLAAGARNPFRAQFLSPISPSDLMVTAGYFIPGRRSLMQIQFLKGITGYIWVFPRADHVSAGIACKMGEISTAELRRLLEQWLAKNGYDLEGAQFYSHILPSFRTQSFNNLQVRGDGWAMIGDSAGLVDPITGEGLYYALRSADLCANALLAGRPDDYRLMLEQELLPELKLAARVSHRFYAGQIFGGNVLEQMVALTAKSASFRELMSDLFAGIQGYRDLRERLVRILPAVMAEGLAGTFRWARSSQEWYGKSGPEFSSDPLAE